MTSYHGHARLNFDTTAVGVDPDNQENEKIQISRLAGGLRIDLTRKLTNAALGVVTFIGHAHGGLVKVDDNATEGEGASKHAGHQSYNGPMLASFGATQLAVDTRRCAYKLHVTFLVHADYAGSKQIQPPPAVAGFFWTATERLPGSLHLVGGDAPDAYTGGCPGDPLLSTQACYDFEGGWAKQVATLARTRGPFDGAAIIWVLIHPQRDSRPLARRIASAPRPLAASRASSSRRVTLRRRA